ncbi:RdRP-domain-containing protein [Cristinia sonorae]|uniref:RNA-dependent RNA polymerase n=1 Tax=Cristinia sonorae TaxID=1940300 RepID=A0A8K0UHF8_9AGAR|nr:RdRP-domain-containing protein [Cristinia sonorae]
MDFTSDFDKDELANNLASVGLTTIDMDELLTRTTKNTRRGTEFSFKPYEMEIGTTSSGVFHQGFISRIDPDGVCIDSPNPTPSSVWIRFHEEMLMFKCFCSNNDAFATRPYEGHLQFRDILPGGIVLSARRIPSVQQHPNPHIKRNHEVDVTLHVRARRPPIYTPRLPHVIVVGTEPYFDRTGTEADFMFGDLQERFAGIVRAVGDPRLFINPGLWLTHVFRFTVTVRQYKVLWMCMVRLRLKKMRPNFEHPENPPPSRPLGQVVLPEVLLDDRDSIFPTRYLFESLLSHGIVSICEVGDLAAAIDAYGQDTRAALLEGLFKKGRRGDIQRDIKAVARLLAPEKIPSHCFKIRRCLVTATRCLLNPPVTETSNDLLRRYADRIDLFMRIQFVDDRGDFPVSGETLAIDDALLGNQGIFARMRRVLQYGIEVCGRHYVFLCFGESQGKARGFWAICERDGFTVQNVLREMGDLSKEKVIAKHAARQGLWLSTTHAVRLNEEWELNEINDIERNGFVFTDGAGRCSAQIAREAAKTIGIDRTPSVIHVRIQSGTKGVLSVVDGATIGSLEIQRRKSQVKFPSTNQTLSVIKVATYNKATLNRQAILLMECLGVPVDVLVDICQNEKAIIEGFGNDGSSLVAKERLALVSTFPLIEVLDAGLGDDPLIKDLVQVIKCRMLSDLRWKQWIEIADSAYLMGIPDETNSLKEGQIFVQVEPPTKGSMVVQGPCTVYRNPCRTYPLPQNWSKFDAMNTTVHPGDVRLVQAVDCEALRHLRNVVVFSTHGARPLPNMLAGGDL